MRYLSLLLLTLFIACSNQTPKNMTEAVNGLIAQDQYAQALDLLNNADSTETEADLSTLKEKTHLNYGLYLEYRGSEGSSMRDRMTSALRQYIEVLKINPHNQTARGEIKQIMSIYSTMPSRSPGEEIMNELRKLGFEYGSGQQSAVSN